MRFEPNRSTLITAAAICVAAPLASAQLVRSGAAVDADGLAPTLDLFRADLGELNAPNPGSIGAGRREINWDAAPDAVSAPNSFPGDFFNAPFFPRARGAVFTTPGADFQLSATAASGVGTLFSNINDSYDDQFQTFSPERLFTPIGSNIVDVEFKIPGEDTPALSTGFGAVFTDVDLANSTTLEFFDAGDNSLGAWSVEAGPEAQASLSFLGVSWEQAVVSRVRITSGEIALGDAEGAADLVVMDDFIYGEPIIPGQPIVRAGAAADPTGLEAIIDTYRNDLGDLNAPNPGSVGSGRREINWDAAPDAVSAPNDFPGDFFNAPFFPRARGAEFTTNAGDLFQLSATQESGVGVNFSNIDPSYADLFSTFSPERLFTPINTTTLTVDFKIPGEDTPAVTTGFGAVFTDVDTDNAATIECFDANGASLGVFAAPVGPTDNGALSFVGVKFPTPIVAKVVITTGNAPLGGLEADGTDLIVMDDFIYGEPVTPAPLCADLTGDGVVDSGDLNIILASFNVNDAGDLDGDGLTYSTDLNIVLAQFGDTCE